MTYTRMAPDAYELMRRTLDQRVSELPPAAVSLAKARKLELAERKARA